MVGLLSTSDMLHIAWPILLQVPSHQPILVTKDGIGANTSRDSEKVREKHKTKGKVNCIVEDWPPTC